MENEESVTLNLKGTITFETKISNVLAVQIMTLCVSGSTAPTAPILTRGMQMQSIKESVAEYLVRVGAKRNTDKILAFATYLLEQQQKSSVSPEELKLLFREAGESLPANFTRDFNHTATSGWLASEPQKKGYYYVTRTGLNIVEKGFEEAPIKRPKKHSAEKKNNQTDAD